MDFFRRILDFTRLFQFQNAAPAPATTFAPTPARPILTPRSRRRYQEPASRYNIFDGAPVRSTANLRHFFAAVRPIVLEKRKRMADEAYPAVKRMKLEIDNQVGMQVRIIEKRLERQMEEEKAEYLAELNREQDRRVLQKLARERAEVKKELEVARRITSDAKRQREYYYRALAGLWKERQKFFEAGWREGEKKGDEEAKARLKRHLEVMPGSWR